MNDIMEITIKGRLKSLTELGALFATLEKAVSPYPDIVIEIPAGKNERTQWSKNRTDGEETPTETRLTGQRT